MEGTDRRTVATDIGIMPPAGLPAGASQKTNQFIDEVNLTSTITASLAGRLDNETDTYTYAIVFKLKIALFERDS